MKNIKPIKKTLIAALALVMVFAMSTSAFAEHAEGDDGWYITGTPTSYNGKINVKLVIESREYSSTDSEKINVATTVEVGVPNVPNQTFTVADVVRAYNNSQTAIKACDYNDNPIGPNENYIYSFRKGNKYYKPIFTSNHGAGPIQCDGWMFRVNGQYPLSSNNLPAGPMGTAINTTYVSDGDVVFFYTNYPWKENGVNMSTNYLEADISRNGALFTIDLKSSNDWFNDAPSYFWNISTYADVVNLPSNITAYIIKPNGMLLGSVNINATTGIGTAAFVGAPTGTYYAMTTIPARPYKNINIGGVSCNCIDTTRLYTKFNG